MTAFFLSGSAAQCHGRDGLVGITAQAEIGLEPLLTLQVRVGGGRFWAQGLGFWVMGLI